MHNGDRRRRKKDMKFNAARLRKGKTMSDSYRTRVVANPQVMAGKPVIKGTRIPVELIVRLVAQGIPEKDILRDYPSLAQADIQAALWYAVALLNQEEVYPLAVEGEA